MLSRILEPRHKLKSCLLVGKNCFPILPVNRHDLVRRERLLLQAPPIDTVPIRIAPWHVERTDSAGAAKPVLRGAGIEPVLR